MSRYPVKNSASHLLELLDSMRICVANTRIGRCIGGKAMQTLLDPSRLLVVRIDKRSGLEREEQTVYYTVLM